MFDLTNPDTYNQLKPGSTISLSDKETLMDNQLQSRNYSVNRVQRICSLENLVRWGLFHLQSTDGPLQGKLIMVKVADKNEYDIRIYKPLVEVPPMSRKEHIDNRNFWLFQDPGKPDFKPLELKYTLDTFYEDDAKVKANYLQKRQGELCGEVYEYPERTGMRNLMATVVEYNSKDATTWPEMLITEVGDKYNDNGGEISIYLGKPLARTDIQVLPL